MNDLQKERAINQKILFHKVIEHLSSKKLYDKIKLELCYAPYTSVQIPVDTYPSESTLSKLEGAISESEQLKKLGETQIKLLFDEVKFLLVLVILIPYEGEYFDIEELIEVGDENGD